MRIYIEGTVLFERRTGIGQYAKRLTEALVKLDKKTLYTIFKFRVLVKRIPRDLPIRPRKNLGYDFLRLVPGAFYVRGHKMRVVPPIDWLFRKRADIIIFPHFFRWPTSKSVRSVVLVHDLSFLLHGEHVPPATRTHLLREVPLALRRASKIITISESTKRQLVEHYGADPAKISVITPAVDHSEYKPRGKAEVDKIRKKYRLTDKYIFYSGTIEPRKNIIGILRAYERLPKRIRDEHELVFSGGKGWLDKEIESELQRLAYLNFKLLGYTPDEDLPALYTGAELFVFPSFYEGWGMPVLEAMACGVPVIASNNSSLPEVAGGAAILIEATDTARLTDEISRVLTDAKLHARMRQASLKQAARFSWENSAKLLHKVLTGLV